MVFNFARLLGSMTDFIFKTGNKEVWSMPI